MKKKIVYICSPYRGNIPLHVAQAKTMCRFVLKKGAIPLAPHLYFPQFMNDMNHTERESTMEMNMQLMELCDEVWVFGDRITKGMSAEIFNAEMSDIHVRYFTEVKK